MISDKDKQIIRFFLKLLLVITVVFICDRGIGIILKKLYFNQKSGQIYRTTYSIDSTSADLLIFGSSRATHHYVPEILEDSLHCTYYNTGRDGNSILYDLAAFKAITARYIPKQIIIDITPVGLEYKPVDYDRLSMLLPYYNEHPEIRNVINLRGPMEKIKHISAIYPFNSLIIQIVLGNLEYNKKRYPDVKGYLPIYKTMSQEKIDTLILNNYNLDTNKVQAVKEIISICKQKNIKVLFIFSPTWHLTKNNQYSKLISEICSENGIKYIDMSNHSSFINNPSYFADGSHLNDEGAKVFTSMIIDIIRKTY